MDNLCVGLCHQAVDLGTGHNAGAHMVMITQAHVSIRRDPSEFVQALGQCRPLSLVESWFVRDWRNGLLMNSMPQLGHDDRSAAHALHKGHRGSKVFQCAVMHFVYGKECTGPWFRPSQAALR